MVRPLGSLVLVLVLTVPAGAQGLLTRMRLATDDHSQPSSPASPAPAPNRLVVTQHWYDGLSGGRSDPRAVLAAGALALVGATSPLWLPAAVFEEHFYSPGSFPGHPYALPGTGYIETGIVYGSNDELDWFDGQRVKPWATRLAVEEGHDFGTLNRVSGRFAVDTKSRFGITADWDHYTERLAGGGTDETTIADINLTLRVAQTVWGQMHAGIGARGLFDSYRTRGGVNFQYGADIFPVDPVVVSTLLELGNLNDAFVMRLRANVGVQLRHVELFGGYDWLRIGGVDLHGPMAGVRLWF